MGYFSLLEVEVARQGVGRCGKDHGLFEQGLQKSNPDAHPFATGQRKSENRYLSSIRDQPIIPYRSDYLTSCVSFVLN